MVDATLDTRQQLQSRMLRRRGILILSLFGILWAAVGASGLSADIAGTARIIGMVLGVGVILLGYRPAGRTSPERQRSQPAGWYRKIGVVNLVQAAAIALTVLGLIAAGVPQMVPPVVCLIVGMHFLPLAKLFDQPQYFWTGAGLTAAAIAGFLILMLGPGAETSRIVIGFAAAGTLWTTSVLLAVRS